MLKRPEGAQPELLLHFEFARNNGYYLEIKEGYWRAEAWKEEGLRRILAHENEWMPWLQRFPIITLKKFKNKGNLLKWIEELYV